MRRILVVTLLVVSTGAALRAADEGLVRITFVAETARTRASEPQTTEGKVVQETDQGIVILLDRSGRLWPILPQNLKSREETGKPFTPYSQREIAEELRTEFGDGFEIVTTKHYVLCTEADREYARWAGSLFERLMAAFTKYWDYRKLDPKEPEFPLCAIVLKDEASFKSFAVKDAGESALGALGYYSQMTNRMVMYDLTAGAGGRRPQSPLEYNLRLAGQVANVSTVVHEATHQIAFNSGLHTRMADNPLWLVEGLAMYFETPDLKNASGWRSVGQTNLNRLGNYREYAKVRRGGDAIKAIISRDEKFQSASTAIDAYAEAWALTDFLIKRKTSAYAKYLDQASKQEVLGEVTPSERIAAFEAAFGKLPDVEKELNRYIAGLGGR